MKYLVTGTTGFIGPHLINYLLEKGEKVYGLIHNKSKQEDILDTISKENYNKINFLYGDVEKRSDMENILKNNEFYGVFHLAGQCHPPTSFKYPLETFNLNTMGTLNIVNSIQEFQPECKMMFASTGEVYGAVPEEAGKINENFVLNPVNPYGVSKVAAETYIRERVKSKGLQIFITRSFSITGPRRRENFAISSDAYQIARIKLGKQNLPIKVGNLEAKRIVTDVRNHVDAYVALMGNFIPGEAYNVSGDDLYSIGDLLKKMCEIEGIEYKVEKEPAFFRPIDIPVQVPDSTKLKKQTGWNAKIPMEQTLADLLNYCKSKV